VTKIITINLYKVNKLAIFHYLDRVFNKSAIKEIMHVIVCEC